MESNLIWNICGLNLSDLITHLKFRDCYNTPANSFFYRYLIHFRNFQTWIHLFKFRLQIDAAGAMVLMNHLSFIYLFFTPHYHLTTINQRHLSNFHSPDFQQICFHYPKIISVKFDVQKSILFHYDFLSE